LDLLIFQAEPRFFAPSQAGPQSLIYLPVVGMTGKYCLVVPGLLIEMGIHMTFTFQVTGVTDVSLCSWTPVFKLISSITTSPSS
jgi:hypothetical protein